jgi:hypothetical protein
VSDEPCKTDDNLPANESGPNVFIVSSIIPRAPLPLKGFIKAVGKPSTNRVSAPNAAKNDFAPFMITSNVPLVRSMLIAINIPTMYGMIRTEVFKPAFCPFYKSIKHIYLFIQTTKHDQKENAEDNAIA